MNSALSHIKIIFRRQPRILSPQKSWSLWILVLSRFGPISIYLFLQMSVYLSRLYGFTANKDNRESTVFNLWVLFDNSCPCCSAFFIFIRFHFIPLKVDWIWWKKHTVATTTTLALDLPDQIYLRLYSTLFCNICLLIYILSNYLQCIWTAPLPCKISTVVLTRILSTK